MSSAEPETGFSPPPVLRAFNKYRDAYRELLDTVESGGLDHFDDAELLEFTQQLETLRNQTAQLDHHVVGAVVDRDLADRQCQSSPARLLASRLLISNGEAWRRVRAAAAVGERRTALGQPLEPVRPVLAAAQACGAVGPENVNIVVRALNKVTGRGFDQAAIDDGEALLADFATKFGPEDLRRLAQQVIDGIDPDGSLPDDEVRDRRSFELSRSGDNAWRCTGLLTGETGVQLAAYLQAHAQPRPAVPDLANGPWTVDERTRTQRLHDALGDLAARGLREGGGAQTTTGAPTVIITIDADDLLDRIDEDSDDVEASSRSTSSGNEDTTCAESVGAASSATGSGDDRAFRKPAKRWRLGNGHGITSDGTILSVAEIAMLATEAEIITVWMSSTGEILDEGRTKRCATRAQTLALIARDVGCSFPGCDRPPEWCERHHIISWLLNGDTDIDNLTLLCRYHHHNFEQRGWTCRIDSDGLPEWTPPTWIDRAQMPMINRRILVRTVRRQ